ncbi:unnamed protein product [Blepharisma stoltei]|uniref:Anaphase-promoting complex subunit 4 WD40 domain-containing protein n=1 Tax=Blepharisma stoltei TaxID=1481888 RepID=A0AAU9JE16_9CILI|nr:unnamed protein product [Blepharisma stoltei]
MNLFYENSMSCKFSVIKKFRIGQKQIFTKKLINLIIARKFISNLSNCKDLNLIKESYLNKIDLKASPWLSGPIKDFLNESLKEILYSIVLLSRTADSIILAAINAIMLLNKAGFLFINKNLSNLKIPNADLSYGMFIDTNFESCNLSGVNFCNAHIYGSNFKNSNMAKVKFGEKVLMSNFIINVEALIFSPCGRFLAVAEDKTIYLYNSKTYQKFKQLIEDFPIRSLLFSDNGNYLLSRNSEMNAILWDISSSLKIGEFVRLIGSSGFSRCNNFLCFACACIDFNNKAIKVYSINTRNIICEISSISFQFWINFVIFSYSGKNLVVLSSGNSLTVLNLSSKRMINQIVCQYQNPIVISYNRKYIAFHYGNSKLFVYSTEKLEILISFETNHYQFDLLAFSPCGRYIALSLQKKAIEVFDLKLKEKIYKIFCNKTSIVKYINFHSNGKNIVAITSDRNLQSWKIPLDIEISKKYIARKGMTMASFSYDCQYFAAADEEGWIFIFLTENKKLYKEFQAHNKDILCISWSRDVLASSSRDLMIKIWDIYNGIPLKIIHTNLLSSWIEFSSDGKNLLACGFPNLINIWNIDNCQIPRTWSHHCKKVSMSHWSRCGDFLITGSSDKSISILNVNSLEILSELTDHRHEVDLISISICGKLLASCDLDKNVKIWYLGDFNHSYQEIKVTKQFNVGNLISSIVWTPDGNLILGDGEGKILVFNFYIQKSVQSVDAHKGLVASLDCSMNGKLIISSSKDRTVKIWKLDR